MAGLLHLGDYNQAIHLIQNRAQYRIGPEAEKELAEALPMITADSSLQATADQDPPNLEACLEYLEAIHENEPTGFAIRYLWRAAQDPNAPPQMLLGLKFRLAQRLARESPQEARLLLDEILQQRELLGPEGTKAVLEFQQRLLEAK